MSTTTETTPYRFPTARLWACIAIFALAVGTAAVVSNRARESASEASGHDWDYYQATRSYVILHPGTSDYIPSKRPDGWKKGDRIPYQARQVMPR